jgi:hypothetical protein
VFLGLTFLLLIVMILPSIRKKRDVAFHEPDAV